MGLKGDSASRVTVKAFGATLEHQAGMHCLQQPHCRAGAEELRSESLLYPQPGDGGPMRCSPDSLGLREDHNLFLLWAGKQCFHSSCLCKVPPKQ